jgi:type IV pilus assembly protein PilV
MRSGGYSLIEVLVAMLVLAIGVLGAAATQAVALRMRHDSDLMAAAIRLGSTLGERMRANPAAASAYLFEFDGGAGSRPAAPSTQCFTGSTCTPSQLAAFDIHEVSQLLASTFPGGHVKVCRDAQPWNPARESLQWQCAGSAGAPYVIKVGWRQRMQASNSSRAPDDAPRLALPLPELVP